jgi:hypothetical protein
MRQKYQQQQLLPGQRMQSMMSLSKHDAGLFIENLQML